MFKKNMPLPEPIELTWDNEHPEESLNKVIDYARTAATNAHTWYAKEKVRKSFFAKTLRALSILLTGAAGIIPILSAIKIVGAEGASEPMLQPIWASVACSISPYSPMLAEPLT